MPELSLKLMLTCFKAHRHTPPPLPRNIIIYKLQKETAFCSATIFRAVHLEYALMFES